MPDQPSLRFSPAEIPHWADRYDYPKSEADLIALAETVQSRGYLLKEELKAVAVWKAARSARHAAKNSTDFLKEVTRVALRTSDERLRIEVLTLLDGVQWPTASAILHIFHPDPYPILDFRALWSVGLDQPSVYRFRYWWTYVEYSRELSKLHSVGMRRLDQALWQYSKVNQRA